MDVVKEVKAFMYKSDLLKIRKDIGGDLKTVMSKISVKWNVIEKMGTAEDQTKMEGPKFILIHIFMEDKCLLQVSEVIHDYRCYILVWNRFSNSTELCNN